MVRIISLFWIALVCLGLVVGSLTSAPLPVQASPLELSVVCYSSLQSDIMAQWIQADLAKIGITAQLQTFGTITEAMNAWFILNKYDLMVNGYVINPYADSLDPFVIYKIYLGRDSQPELNDIFYQTQATLNATERELGLQQLSWLVHRDVPYMPLVLPQHYLAAVKGITGLTTNPFEMDTYYGNASKPGLDTLIMPTQFQLYSLDPTETGYVPQFITYRHLFDSLYNTAADENRIFPALATNYSIGGTPNGTEWTFTLRQGVQFHDGTPFNASAVEFTFNRLLQADNQSSPYVLNGWAPRIDFIAYGLSWVQDNLNRLRLVVEAVTALDEYTVQFTLTQPYGLLREFLTWRSFNIVSPSHIMRHNDSTDPDHISNHPVGTGPYQFAHWEPAQTFTITRFADYWGYPAQTPTLIWKYIPVQTNMLNELIAEQIHIILGVWLRPQDFQVVADTSNIELVDPIRTAAVYNMIFNGFRAPFNDTTSITDPDFGGTTLKATLARRAFMYAINRSQLAEHVFFNYAEAPNTTLSSDWPGFNASIEPYPYDPEHAMELFRLIGIDLVRPGRVGVDPLLAVLTTLGGVICLVVLRTTYLKRNRVPPTD